MQASDSRENTQTLDQSEDEDDLMTMEQLVESLGPLKTDLSKEESELEQLQTCLDCAQDEEEYKKLVQKVELAKEVIASLKEVIRITKEEISIVEAESGSSDGEDSDQQPHPTSEAHCPTDSTLSLMMKSIIE